MKPILKGLAALLVLTMLTCNAHALDPMTRQVIVGWTKCMAEKYHVDPAFALAVAHIESRGPGQEFRTGLLGHRWYGPFNIEKSFLSRWNIKDTCTNVEVGVRALRGNPQKVLKRYNAAYDPSYGKAVFEAMKKYNRQ